MALHHIPAAPAGGLVIGDASELDRRSSTRSDWRECLPVLRGSRVTLRELRAADAPALFAMLSDEETTRFVSAPPSTVAGVENFIAWTQRERADGVHVCYGIVADEGSDPIGIIQVRQASADFSTAEWGFAIGSAHWGRGLFAEAAALAIAFAFNVLGVHRLEARAAVKNGRGNAALRKLGAVQEGILRGSLVRNGEYLDQVLWTILETDRRQAPRLSIAVH